MAQRQASVFVPSMFIAHEPQIPSRHDRLNVSVESTSFLILRSASSIIGPQSFRSISYFCERGGAPASGSQR
jgi:hypothetical protein